MSQKRLIQAGPVLILLVIVLVTALLFPGDASFLNDEPQLLHQALTENHQPLHILGISLPFTPSPVGLPGTRGVCYGPLPVWIYQALLGITLDPVAIVAMRAFLFTASTALALAWLARSMRLSLWFAALSMLSPWLWSYSRQLWDNSFGIPLSAIALASYADFLIAPRRWTLLLCVISLAAMSLVHLMAAPLIAAVGLHVLLFQRRSVARYRWGVLIIGVIWLWVFLRSIQTPPMIPPAPNQGPPPSDLGWFNPLLGAHHLTAAFDWLPSTRGHLPIILVACQAVSLLPHLAVWIGMCWIIRRAVGGWRSFTPVDHLALLALAAAALQSVLDGVVRIGPQPNFFNATWVVYLVLAWYGVDAIGRWIWKPLLTIRLPLAAYVASTAAVLITSIILIHRNGGTRTIDYGTVLADQMQAARRIQQFSPRSPVEVVYFQWRDFPWAKSALLELSAPPPGPQPLRQLLIRYRDDYPQDARIAVDDFPLPPP